MFDVDFNALGEGDLRFFQSEYVTIFSRVLDSLKRHKDFVDGRMGVRQGTDSGAKPDFPKKADRLAKKVAVNTLISHFTGIEPMTLDNDTSFLLDKPYEYARFLPEHLKDASNERKNKYYMHCNLKHLVCTVIYDLHDGVSQFMEKLKTEDVDSLREVLLIIHDYETYNYGFEAKRGYVKAAMSYELMLYPLLYEFGIVSADKINRGLSMSRRGYRVDMRIPFIDNIAAVYAKYLHHNTASSAPVPLTKASFNPAWLIEGSTWVKCPQCGEKRPTNFIRAVGKCPKCGLSAFDE